MVPVEVEREAEKAMRDIKAKMPYEKLSKKYDGGVLDIAYSNLEAEHEREVENEIYRQEMEMERLSFED